MNIEIQNLQEGNEILLHSGRNETAIVEMVTTDHGVTEVLLMDGRTHTTTSTALVTVFS